MSNLLEAIEASAYKEIEADGMVWKLRKICSADLAEVGHAALAMSQGMASTDAKPSDAEAQKMMAAQSKDKLQTMARLKDAVTAAGLIGVRDVQSDDWVQVKCVLDSEKSDPKNGTIWVGSLPNHVADLLFSEILSLATDGGAAVERLQAFREKSRQPTPAGPGCETVQHAPGAGA